MITIYLRDLVAYCIRLFKEGKLDDQGRQIADPHLSISTATEIKDRPEIPEQVRQDYETYDRGIYSISTNTNWIKDRYGISIYEAQEIAKVLSK